ncbi:glycosyltransferase family 2 protein [Haloplasma contractile]|uniref:Glycosyltransferase EpsH protein n=1 Tax=Haloplasma contractile SSD-17B TaxID=1033810 RepID=U2E780_9MOLU|nr:glycosyltransferase family 2 protein [Haloplasma contractile]ERJ11053.1 Putative glycosyltransferase EpsH protein [Haloplasma contractile SSD-17B]
MEKISVICPVYNSEDFIGDLIRSLQRQTYSNFECIFVDDCSNDKSCELLMNIKESRFNVYQNEVNLGAQKSRKKGYLKATGEFVTFIDSDDHLDPHFLEKMIFKIKNDHSDVVMCNYKVIDTHNKVIRENKAVTPVNHSCFPVNPEQEPQVILSKPAFWNKLYRNAFLIKYIDFPDVKLAQDLAVIPYVLSKANKISYVDDSLYCYRIKQDSISNTYDEQLLEINKSLEQLTHRLESHYQDELEFMTIGHSFFQMSKTIFIKEKAKRIEIYQQLRDYIEETYPNYKKNKHFKKRLDYKVFTFILRQTFLIKSTLLNYIIKFIVKNRLINKLIRKSDK